jgi:uncharacterized membrane protein
MSKMILGIFTDKSHAEHAVEELEGKGYNAKDISIIMRDHKGKVRHNRGENVAGGALSGATTGGVLGGLAGLLIGLGTIAIPGVGALLIGGPLAAALGLTGAAATTVSGAVTGALAGGLVGGLIGLGIPEEEAKYYEDRIKEGGILVAIPMRFEDRDEAKAILEEHGAEMIRVIDMTDTRTSRARDEYQPHYH